MSVWGWLLAACSAAACRVSLYAWVGLRVRQTVLTRTGSTAAASRSACFAGSCTRSAELQGGVDQGETSVWSLSEPDGALHVSLLRRRQDWSPVGDMGGSASCLGCVLSQREGHDSA